MPGAPWDTGSGDPYKRIAAAIVLRAIDDCNCSDKNRAYGALVFLYSPNCELFCDLLGTVPDNLHNLRDAIAISWGWRPDDFSRD